MSCIQVFYASAAQKNGLDATKTQATRVSRLFVEDFLNKIIYKPVNQKLLGQATLHALRTTVGLRATSTHEDLPCNLVEKWM